MRRVMEWKIGRRTLRPLAIGTDDIRSRLARARFIPVSDPHEDPALLAESPAGEAIGAAGAAAAAVPATAGEKTGGILIVEDDPDNREALADILDEEGYKVRTASNGLDALEMLQRSAPDALPGVILLDLMMPVMDGWEFLRRRSEDPRLARIPVFVLSGAADFGQDRSMRDILRFTKPIDLSALLTAIDRICG